MNKKGILIGEALKMILGVIVILILIALIVELYGVVGKKTHLEQAKVHIEKIEKIVERLEVQGGGEEEYVLLNPKGWALVAWPGIEVIEGKGPEEIFSRASFDTPPEFCIRQGWENCLCLCDAPDSMETLMLEEGAVTFSREGINYYGGGAISSFEQFRNKCNLCFELPEKGLVSSDSLDNRNSFLSVDDLVDKRKSLKISLEGGQIEFRPTE